jgi:hypothetical protein
MISRLNLWLSLWSRIGAAFATAPSSLVVRGLYRRMIVGKRKYRKKTPRQKMVKKLDELWSLIVRKVGYCELCGKPGYERRDGLRIAGLDAHHIIYRRNYMFRWDVMNGICLCPGCHEFGTDFDGQVIAAHIDSEVWMEKVRDKLPDYGEWYDENKYSKLVRTMTLDEMERIFDDLKDQMVF